MYRNTQFWLDSLWRSCRTFAQSLAGMLLVVQASGSLDVSWYEFLYASGIAALISLLQSIDRERAVGASTVSPSSPEPVAPADANYIPPAALVSGCGGDPR